MKSIEEVVQFNLECYNNRDIIGFMESFDEGIEMYMFGNDTPFAKGIKEVKAYYTKVFDESPNLHSTILNRIIFDNKVIDHESISGRMGNEKEMEMILIYEIIHGKIIKTTAIKNKVK